MKGNEIDNKFESSLISSSFSTLNDKIGCVRLNEISPGLGDRAIQLMELVVPLRSDITVSAVINENGLDTLKLHRISNTNHCIATITKGKLCEEVTYKKRVKINDDFVSSIYDAADNILKGDTYKGLSIRPRPLIYSPLWTAGEKREFAYVDVLSASNLFQYVVILGAPGSGKTTTAKAIATAHFEKFIDNTHQDNVSVLGLWDDENNLPIYIELKSLVSDPIFPSINSKLPNVELFKTYIKQNLYGNSDIVMNYVLDRLQSGEILLILDGLDEVPIPNTEEDAIEKRHNQLQNLIRSIKTVFPKIKIIVTSRPAGYSGWTLDGFETIHILPLSSNEAAKLAYSYYIAAGEKEESSKDLTKKLIVEIERLPNKIREYPLFICLLASIFRDKKGEFPAKRGGLLQVSLDTLLGTWTIRRHEGKTLQDILNCSPYQIVKCLSQISFRALSEIGIYRNTDTPDVPISMALEEFYLLGDHINPTQVLNYIMNQAGILTSPAQRKLRFVHRLFQEYLAALAISQQDDSVGEMTDLVIKNPILWTEVALLFADILSNKKLNGELLLFIEQLLTRIDDCNDKALIYALVASVIVDEEFHNLSESIRTSASIKTCIEKLQSCLYLPDLGLSGQQRFLIGLALNEVGDPRIGVSLDKHGLPEFCWERIPSGEFYMGSEIDSCEMLSEISRIGEWNLNREKPRHCVKIKTFEISRYPVTNEQFNSFVLADDGYVNDEWWTESGLIWRDKNGPPPTLLSLSKNSPQNCTTWYEAIAFCRWYSKKTNQIVRLPTEAEWEYVARGINSSYEYIWGNECNPEFANVKESGVSKVSPVGCFPVKNKSHEGVEIFDLNGNVWEWCSSIVEDDCNNKFSYPYNKNDGRENIDLDDHFFRATRGGFYGGGWMYARSCYRGRDFPSLRAERQGFRVVRECE